jgi:kynurenine formamidase
MQVIDLTHTLETGMPVFPGSEPASLSKISDCESDGYNETLLHFSAHTGTHIDCGRHFIRDGFDTAETPPGRFFGKGLVIDCRQGISKSRLQLYEKKIENSDFVLLFTGWSRFWGGNEYMTGFPVPDPEAVRYLTRFKLKGIGTDAISFDPVETHDYVAHKTLLAAGMVLIENLVRLEDLPAEGFLFCCFPLKIAGGDGSPVRAVGIVMSNE